MNIHLGSHKKYLATLRDWATEADNRVQQHACIPKLADVYRDKADALRWAVSSLMDSE